ncbi:hypothetical protein ABZ858_15085 [Streptomyces sp. NPDC047017]|uniref:hypothetical protein n=1 Tax=Streptomyces sp. NPDC047017 TaxID=3155024 RepID=UPI0033E9337F
MRGHRGARGGAPEAPFAESLLPTHARHLARAYGKGEPDAAAMVRNLLEPGRLAPSPALRQYRDDIGRHR